MDNENLENQQPALPPAYYDDVIKAWDREPSWEEFKRAVDFDDVKVFKPIAQEAYNKPDMVKKKNNFLFNVITLIGMLSTLIGVGVILVCKISWWWIIAFIIFGNLLTHTTQNRKSVLLKEAAVEDERLYQYLMKAGAFYFEPPTESEE